MEMVIKRQQALRKQGKKGFTLVELIVVIVILGILAAIAVPALVGYIDKARTDGAVTEAATARTAMQTIASDAYARGGSYKPATGALVTGVLTATGGNTGTAPFATIVTQINTLTGATYSATTVPATPVGSWTVAAGRVTAFTIQTPSGVSVSWAPGTGYVIN